jgi:hypothetical protein
MSVRSGASRSGLRGGARWATPGAQAGSWQARRPIRRTRSPISAATGVQRGLGSGAGGESVPHVAGATVMRPGCCGQFHGVAELAAQVASGAEPGGADGEGAQDQVTGVRGDGGGQRVLPPGRRVGGWRGERVRRELHGGVAEPGRTPAGSSPRTSPSTWPPGPAFSATTTSRAAGSQPRYAPLPGLAPARPARPPRPAADPRDQPRLAMGRRRRPPHQLAAAPRPARTSLTGTNHPHNAEGGPPRRGRSRRAPGHTGQRGRYRLIRTSVDFTGPPDALRHAGGERELSLA